MNCFLEYYDKHNISPVKQKIDDIEIHHKKEKNCTDSWECRR